MPLGVPRILIPFNRDKRFPDPKAVDARTSGTVPQVTQRRFLSCSMFIRRMVIQLLNFVVEIREERNYFLRIRMKRGINIIIEFAPDSRRPFDPLFQQQRAR